MSKCLKNRNVHSRKGTTPKRIRRVEMLTITTFIAFSVNLAFSPNSAHSQAVQPPPQLYSVSDQTQTPIPGAGHDYQHLLNETVNLSNGSVSFKIAFPVPQGRGITIPAAWSYNSAAVSPLDATNGLTPTWDNPAMHFWPMVDGWNLAEGLPLATVQLWSVSAVNPNQTVVPCNYQSGMTFTDMSGVTHNLGTGAQATAAIYSSGGVTYTCGESQVTLPPFGDGQVVATPNPQTGSVSLYSPEPSNGSFVVMDKNGTIYNFGPGQANLPYGPNARIYTAMIEDRNGNEITPSTAGYTDTRGQPEQLPNGGPSNSSFTIDGLTYTPTWTTLNWSYSGSAQLAPPANGTLCGGGSSFPSPASGTRSVLSSLTLPNNQQFQFFYDNNGDGLLNEIIYPDGGWVKYTWQYPSGFNEMTSLSGQVITGQSGEDQFTYGVVPYGCVWQYQTPVLAMRQVSFDGTTVAQTQSFQFNTYWSYTDGVVNYWTSKTATVTTTDNKVGALASAPSTTVYTYLPYGSTAQPFANGYNAQSIPLESSIVYYDWGKSTPVKTVTKSWLDQFNMASETTVNAANQVAETYYSYYSPQTGYACPTSQQNSENSTFVYLQEQDDWDFGLLSPPPAPTTGGPATKPTVPPTKRTLYSYNCFGPTNIPAYSSNANGGVNYANGTTEFPGLWLPPKVSSVVVENGSGTILAATTYQYDGASLTAVSPAPTQLDTANFAGVTVRGNLTSVTKCYPAPASMSAVATCSGPTTTYTYDVTGQPSSMIDACGNSSCTDMSGTNHTTYYSFADNPVGGNSKGNTNAYLTNIKYPTTAAGVTLQKSFQYNYPLGYLVESIDENSQATTYTYNDSLNRLTQVNYPDGGETTISYTDVAPSPTITTSKEINNSPLWETSVATMDGMEHVVETQLTSDPAGTDTVLTTYNGEGKAYTKTNPFRGTSAPASTTTYFYYDALGRAIETVQQDSSTLQTCYDGAVSVPAVGNCSAHLGANLTQVGSLTGTWVDSTDENGNHWQRSSDAFGRLTQVMEPNGSTQSPTMETDYNYSYLNDLLTVTQWGGANGTSGARSRSFSYDNLSRLGSAANPETGTIIYAYDANNNVQTKIDARGIATSYTYDSLNRLLLKTYSNDPGSTPFSCYQYDLSSVPYGQGRLSNAWTQRASGTPSCPASSFLTERSILAYDQMGRPTSAQQQQCVGSQCSAPTSYSLTMAYDLVGNMKTLINPVGASGSSLTLNNYFDGASRPCLTTSSWSGSFPANLFQTNPSTSGSTVGYTPFGSLQNWYMGAPSSTASTSCSTTPTSPINITQGYTNRLWVNSIAATGQIP